ncbi:haloacid dehalogenase-like hydrolase [Saccharopolyspora shandongensis]|uniref:HAD family hydrolase n=1 Tax=Saccharopolyspora shandongensis TaxID=418495 RepID=UPI00342308C6
MTTRTAIVDLDGVLYAADTFATLAIHRYRRSPGRALAVAASAPRLAWAWRHEHLRPGVLRRLATRAVAGMEQSAYDALARQLAKEMARSARVVWDGVSVLRGLRDAGWRVIVATASEHELASAYLRGIGLDAVELVASHLDPTAGRFVVHNHGTEKVRQLELAGCTRWDLAYTDSLSDLPLLAHATRPVLVNANSTLARKAADRLGIEPEVVLWSAGRSR